MSTITIQEAQARLSEVIHRLAPGEEIVITEDDRPVARLTLTATPQQRPRRLGTMRGTILHMAPDFDEPLDDFREYVARIW
ncbi:type II toxin-antitoxin system Phd/YefM family antitoxin [Paludisphaera mucosa]|uniref:Antitoxin n=1 Tax=Paludisphaera mucosa TaxID=3030827 RepID=A0ABT6FIX1_9BACT|nr:type II toxin-antitoxin system Phd/YefM family antitoxin [Paludisphaera mucosa]MDG3007531.1 type II toxin-antitoxin system Phd/YefM family antitoxin [Paludisphaera mucosa]